MRANLKVLLVLELFVCFAPATLLLFFGLLFLPVSFVINPQLGNLDALAMVVGGLCGIVGIAVVVAALLSEKRPRLSTPTILVLAALGIASLLPLVVGSVDSLSWRLLGLLPILAGAHVIYLARSLLFKSRVAPSGRHDDVYLCGRAILERLGRARRRRAERACACGALSGLRLARSTPTLGVTMETGISRPQFLAGFALGSAVLYQCSIAWLALKSLQTRIVVLENGARLISNGKEEQFSWNDFGPTKEFTFAGVSKLTRRDGRSVLYVFDNMRNLQAVKSSIAVVQH